jgi:acetyl-CoA acetyltransferase
MSGTQDIVIASGVESMSRVPMGTYFQALSFQSIYIIYSNILI